MEHETQRKRPRRSSADRPGRFRRSARALQLLCGCLVLALLCRVEPARADAPMCDRSGASVEAPPYVPPAKSGSVEELPCGNAEMRSFLEEAVQPRHHAFKELDGHQQRVWLVSCTIVLYAPSQPSVAATPDGLAPLRGHPRPVYRPPLAA